MANDRIESLVITSGHCTWYKIKGDSIYIYNKLERDIIIYIERKGNDRVRTCIMRVSCLSQTYLTVDMQPTHLFMNVRENPSYFLTDQNPIQETDAPEQLHVQKDPFCGRCSGHGASRSLSETLIRSSDQ